MKELTNERIKDMRARIVMIIMAVALIALPTMAQDWQSTSTMQGSGSAYSAQVTAVGAAEATDMATTTESYTPANGAHRARRDFIDPNNPGHQSEEFPIGDAVLPLMLLACAYLIIRVMRRKEV
jgi:hypothetical protein